MSENDIIAYKPDFPAEEWSAEERFLLSPFASDLDGFISVMRNLPPEIVGALCSRASRASGSLVRILHDEYFQPILQGDPALAQELRDTIAFIGEHGFKNILNNQRAQSFYAKWLSQYGDDSIAQMTGTHVIFWGISQVAMKYIEDQRVGLEPIEKSTRYVAFGKKIGGNYLYYTPKPDLEKLGLLENYRAVLDGLFDEYAALVEEMKAWFKANYDEKDGVLEKKAFDTLRGMLPMATLGQVAFRGNAQALEYAINRTAQHELGEFRWIAHTLKQELDKEIPSLLLRANDEKTKRYQGYLAGRTAAVREAIKKTAPELFADEVPPTHPVVELTEYDHDAEDKVLAGILYASSNHGWSECLAKAKRFSPEERSGTLNAYLSGRDARWQKIGRAFENAFVRFDILMDIGSYRDLHRHRMMTQERQLFSVRHGYDVPKEVIDAGFEKRYRAALDSVKPLFAAIEKNSPQLAQYLVPLAYRVRFYQYENLRQFFWEAELRTGPQGHPSYRFIEQEKYRLLKDKLPLIGKFMLVDMNNYDFARRGTEEAIAAKEEKIKQRLQERSEQG
jgi:thymidylate synthase ThyX